MTPQRKKLLFTSNGYTNPYSSLALAWQAKIVANGGTISAYLLTAIDTYIFKPSLLNSLTLGEMDYFRLSVGMSAYPIAAKTSLVGNFLAVGVNSPTLDDNGYYSNGTSSYLKSGFIPSTNGVKFTSTNNHGFAILKAPTFSANRRTFGSLNDSPTKQDLYVRRSSVPNLQARNNSNAATATNSSVITTGNVLVGSKRVGTTVSAMINETAGTTTTASNGLSAQEQWELTTNDGNSPSGEYDTIPHRCLVYGSASIDTASFRTMIDNLCTYLGV